MNKDYIKQWVKLMMLGCVLLMAGAGNAVAAPNGVMSASMHIVSAADESLDDKQAEIDDYVAGAGQEELSREGFTVTHTVAAGDKVEVGITPYNEEHANFLYEKFGRDQVQVVEGEQAILYGANTAEADVVAAEEAGMNLWIWIGAAVVIVAGGLVLVRRKLFSRS